jgi:hypothetical protein
VGDPLCRRRAHFGSSGPNVRGPQVRFAHLGLRVRVPETAGADEGSAISEEAVRGRMRMFLFGSRVSEDSTRRAAMSLDRRFEVEELGEIDMVSRTATLDLVTHDDARPAFPLPLSSADTSAARMGNCPTRCASSSADQR